MAPTLPGEHGLVLVASRRADFPTELEQHLLRVAVGQATISIHTARRLASERAARIAAETALHHRNAFLETLSQNVMVPLARLGEWAAQARALAAEEEHSPPVGADSAIGARGTTGPQTSAQGFSPSARLTRREAEVLGLLAQGLSNKEIAAVLWLSERTVERHITGLYRKIGVERRSEATAFALRYGFVAADVDHE
jgi:DNA-binding NarL/FixJ family response regulator